MPLPGNMNRVQAGLPADHRLPEMILPNLVARDGSVLKGWCYLPSTGCSERPPRATLIDGGYGSWRNLGAVTDRLTRQTLLEFRHRACRFYQEMSGMERQSAQTSRFMKSRENSRNGSEIRRRVDRHRQSLLNPSPRIALVAASQARAPALVAQRLQRFCLAAQLQRADGPPKPRPGPPVAKLGT